MTTVRANIPAFWDAKPRVAARTHNIIVFCSYSSFSFLLNSFSKSIFIKFDFYTHFLHPLSSSVYHAGKRAATAAPWQQKGDRMDLFDFITELSMGLLLLAAFFLDSEKLVEFIAAIYLAQVIRNSSKVR